MSFFVSDEAALPAFRVGPGREYTSFTACVWALRNDLREKIIYIDPGVYDIFREYRESDIPRPPKDLSSVHTYMPYSSILSPGTHVIGLGDVTFRYAPSPEETWDTESKVVSILNLSGTATVENITLTGKNCRYMIHDETLGLPEFSGAQKRYYRVNCLRTEPNDAGLGFPETIGTGFDDRMLLEYTECTFVNRIGGYAFYMHDRGRSGDVNHNFPEREPYERRVYTPEESSRIVCRRCTMDAGPDGRAIRLGNGKIRLRVPVELTDCCFTGSILSCDESSDENGTHPNSYVFSLRSCSPAEIIIRDPSNTYPPQRD